jgi:hypothetical protein
MHFAYQLKYLKYELDGTMRVLAISIWSNNITQTRGIIQMLILLAVTKIQYILEQIIHKVKLFKGQFLQIVSNGTLLVCNIESWQCVLCCY